MMPTTVNPFLIFCALFISLLASQSLNGAEPIKRRDPMRAGEYFGRRVGKEKAKAIDETGGTKESEAAVAAALKWLAAHQIPDGGWHFDHRVGGMCAGRCSHSGALEARNAATAMALLCFLGAGQSHIEGEYKTVVRNGLKFLVAKGEKEGEAVSFLERGGTMYSHGLATLALAEAYGMTKDRKLRGPAQQAVAFIVKAQDPIGGGWRYSPRQAGDMSVTGWQVSALVTAKDAGLDVPPVTFKGVEKFLAACSTDGASYGYTGPGTGKATTAIGLLCQVYGGWKHGEDALKRGVKFLGDSGPSIAGNRASWYYNFYATQILWQYGGDSWKTWDAKLRDELIDMQEKAGHAAGSWFASGDHGSERGGRLYCTAFATLILEAYYRNKPVYERAKE
jgi:hypothetical protein